MGLGWWWKASRRRARVPSLKKWNGRWPAQLPLAGTLSGPVSWGIPFPSIVVKQARAGWKFRLSGLPLPGLKWQERQSVNQSTNEPPLTPNPPPS